MAMFKSILPSRKMPDADFLIVSPQVDSHKENYPASAMNTTKTKSKKSKDKDSPVSMDVVQTEQAFDQLLNDLQVPDVLRPKLARMESGVKAAMLKSSQTISKGSPPLQPPPTIHSLRKAQSAQSMASMTSPLLPEQEQPTSPKGTGRGKSVDVPRTPKADSKTVKEKSKKDKGKETALSPQRYTTVLQSTSSLHLDVEVVKKLRLMLRNEPASWTEEFVWKGGYSALLLRLQELLDVEWREEQHDDQVLHELLRCFKALSTSAVGCVALRSCCPTPFQPLVSLLYSDKRPGDVGSKQLIVELLLLLFELYPPSSLPGNASPALSSDARGHGRSLSVPWETGTPGPSSLVTLPAPHATTFALVRTLLLTPAPPPSEDPRVPVAPHPFIEELHVPRIYKTHLQELNDVCRDYFWVFCHPNNTLWALDETDERKVEQPRAPGGMTGGVEFEAMTYMTMHFKLLNALAAAAEQVHVPREHELSAHRLHTDLFLSGLDRILLVARKASTAYYPTLHLELARYVAAAARAGFELPYSVARTLGPPPSALCRVPARAPSRAGRSHARSQSAVAGPLLPPTRRVTPMFGA